jgi:transposase InsO family protein
LETPGYTTEGKEPGMAYNTNPKLPRLRARAVEMVRAGKKVSEVARYFGYTKGAVSKWCQKYPENGAWVIPTKSSRPHRHPKAVSEQVVQRIKTIRVALKGRCAEVIQKHLSDEGIAVHRITVQRVLDRLGLTKKRNSWKRYHAPSPRPLPAKPGDLVQVDTIHMLTGPSTRIYIYTLIDVCSRWAYAWASARCNVHQSLAFLRKAQAASPFTFHLLQSDHGSEFSQRFTSCIKITHRHSRVRKPNDNAHIERFNRTLQQELLTKLPRTVRAINQALPHYLAYYNQQRYHLGINLKTPAGVIEECFQGIV